jgi:hypothetical protein
LSVASVGLLITPLLLAAMRDHGVNIPIPWWLAPFGSLAMISGFSLSWLTLRCGIRALRGVPPWICHRWAFVAAAALGATGCTGFVVAIGVGLLRRFH